jgi:hypothetical protein
MIRKSRPAARNLAIAIATLLSAALAYGTCAAASRSAATPSPSAAPQQPTQPTQELEEIWVYGKSLVERINDAQDDFFPLYNKANKNDDFDIKCGYARLNPESMIMSRTCLPGFLGKDYAPPPVFTGTCYGNFRITAGFGSNFYSDTAYGMSDGPCPDGGYEPPPPAFIAMAKSAELQKQMAKVISADRQLLEKAAHLGDLYKQLESVQQRFRKAKGIEVKGRRVRAVKVNTKSRDRD